MSEYSGKVVIVTGGAKGIGRAICLSFISAGADVICGDIDPTAGHAIVQETQGAEGRLVFVEADVSKAADCQRLVEQAVALFGGVDVLCNNAGIQPVNSFVPAHELAEEVWERVINVNLKSRFLMTKYAVPEMKKRGGGVIINTASSEGVLSAPLALAYAASKGGDLAITRQLAIEYGKDNIRVMALVPCLTETPLIEELLAAYNTSMNEQRANYSKDFPLQRIGQPQDVANVVLFLASDKASFLSGSYVTIDGGIMAQGMWARW